MQVFVILYTSFLEKFNCSSCSKGLPWVIIKTVVGAKMAGKGETEIYGCACGHDKQRGERTDSTSWYSFQRATAPFPGVLFLMTVAYSIELIAGWRLWPCWLQALQKFSDFKAGQVLPLLITSYELLRKHMDKIASAEPGLLICDEAHRLKNWYYKQPNEFLLYVDFFWLTWKQTRAT